MKRKAREILCARARSSWVFACAADSSGPKTSTSEKYSEAARSRSFSEAYSVLMVLNSPGSSQRPPQLGHSSTTTWRFALAWFSP